MQLRVGRTRRSGVLQRFLSLSNLVFVSKYLSAGFTCIIMCHSPYTLPQAEFFQIVEVVTNSGPQLPSSETFHALAGDSAGSE